VKYPLCVVENVPTQVAQCMLLCGTFAMDGTRLFELCFLLSIMNGDWIDLRSFLAHQLYIAVASNVGKMATAGLITFIARSLGVELNPDDKVSRFEGLNKAAFQQMKFCKIETGHIY